MKFSPLSAPRLGESACSKLSLVWSWNHQFYCGIRPFHRSGKNFCEVSKAGPVVDTSTKIFLRAEIFMAGIWLRSLYSELRRNDCQVPRELMSRTRCKKMKLQGNASSGEIVS